MRAQHDAALEAKDEVLAERLHRLERAAVDPLGDSLRPRPRVRRLDRDPLPDERLETPRGTMDRVALGHGRHRNGRGRVSA